MASSDILFTQFAFKSTGGTNPRTQPDRLADIKNVLDFGADPTGVNDSYTAINNAINWTTGANRGTIFFPSGVYTVSQSLLLNYNGPLSIRFLGTGAGSVLIQNISAGLTGDYLFDRHNVNGGSPSYQQGPIVFEGLTISNITTGGGAGGAVRVGSTIGAAFRDCIFGGVAACVTGEDSPGNCSQNLLFDNCRFGATAGGVGGGTYGGNGPTNGVIIGNGGSLFACDFHSNDVAIRAYGSGFSINDCRLENNNTAICLGQDSSGANQVTRGFFITGTEFEGNSCSIDFVAPCSGFYISAGGLGHSSANNGYPTGNTDSNYGIRVRAGNASSGVFEGCVWGQNFTVASIFIGNASSRANLLFVACVGAQAGSGGVAWTTPTNAFTAWFVNSNTQPVWTFSQLPSGSDVFEGDEFNISDAHTAGSLWGQTVTGSGGVTTRGLVRWNGSAWTLVGV